MIQKNPKILPPRLIQKIEAVKEEEDAYAADELVELGEEILSQLAAMGIAVYLQQQKQKEVFNDFLISLFLSNGHAYNAGPLYRWAANMIKDAEGEDAKLLKPFFWQIKDGKEVLNEEIHHLAGLRNAVMHGFFVLPPERNREEAKRMEIILKDITKAGLFDKTYGNFHFLNEHGFNGHWNITEPKVWDLFSNCFSFGKLADRIALEYAPSFHEKEKQFALHKTTINKEVKKGMEALLEKGKGALVAWTRPGNEQSVSVYRQFVQHLNTEKYYTIHYTLFPQGATFTANFMERALANALVELTNNEKAQKDPWKFLKAQKGKLPKKVVIVLHDVHIALFSPNHLTNLFNKLYDAEVPILATAWHYPYLKRFFNSYIPLPKENSSMENKDLEFSMQNYLRFKGPSEEQASEKSDFDKLKEIVSSIQQELHTSQKVLARRFADQHHYTIEFVHEAFGILSPFYQLDKEKFIKDEVDELYGFPKTIEESSRIFLTLGRRDIKLEYQHKVLTKKRKNGN